MSYQLWPGSKSCIDFVLIEDTYYHLHNKKNVNNTGSEKLYELKNVTNC